jgi:uncharacterized protein YfaS (alpha-2-macroglobulin family)
MKSATQGLIACLFGAIVTLTPGIPVPISEAAERRPLINQDSVYFGLDYEILQDIDLGSCESACLADEQCKAFTYNVATSWCFLKSGVGELRAVSGAVSGRIVSEPEPQTDNKAERLAELSFVPQSHIDEARRFEGKLREQQAPVPHSRLVKILELASEAAGQGDFKQALDQYRSAVGLAPERYDLWKILVDLTFQTPIVSGLITTPKRQAERTSAAINAYLRAESDGDRAMLLALIGNSLKDRNYWKPAIAAYRASLELRSNAAVTERLETLYSSYGFRIVNHVVETEGTEPQVCVVFSENLPEGVNVEPFVSVRPDANLAINTDGKRVCMTGVENGRRYEIVIRSGLLSADGQDLLKSVSLDIFVPDRPPTVRFEGQAYVLPAGGQASIPVISVNTEVIEAEVLRIGDRQLAQAIGDKLFLTQLRGYEADRIVERTGEKVWKGTIEVARALNREITTAIPVSEIVPELKPGAYVITARAANAVRERYWGRKVTQWFVVTDLGLSTLSGSDGFHIFARSLTTARPLSGIELRLVATNNEVLGRATTDAGGYAVLSAGLTKGTGSSAPALLAAEGPGGDYNFLDLTRSPLDLTDRGVDGRPAPGPLDVFLTTERGIYRAGEPVHITALVRDSTAIAVPDVPLTAIVKRPDGIEASRFALSDQGLGGNYSAYQLSASAMRGTWTLSLYTDVEADPLAKTTFLVEDFVPERLDFELEANAEAIDPANPGEVSLTARFLYGQPAGGLSVEGDMVVQPVEGLAAFPNYRFGLIRDGFDPLREPLNGGSTNALGTASLALRLPAALPETSRPLEASINVRVLDPGGKPVERSLTLPVTGKAGRIGIRPLFADAVENDSPAAFQVIAIDANGDQEAAPDLRWELIRIVRRYQWYHTDGRWNYEPIENRQRISGGRLSVSSDQPARLEVTPEWGAHVIVVRDANGDVLPASVRFKAGWYVEAKAIDTPEALKLSFDQPRYRFGDTARIHIDASYPGIAHLMVLDNRLIASKLVEVPEGGAEIELPVTAEWGPGAYVTAALYRPMDLMARRMPARAIGVGWAEVDPGDRQLQVTLETPDNPSPRMPFEAKIKLEKLALGEEAYVTVAAVNAGILNLTRYEPPAPEQWYFAQRSLGTEIRDIYSYLIDRMQGARGVVRSGGDGPLARYYEGPPPSEMLVALHSGIVSVDRDGTATIEFAMPDFNGTVRVMVMAWTRNGVGKAVKDVVVRDPVVIATSGPQFLAPGDQSRLHLDLAASDEGAGRALLEIESLNGAVSVAADNVSRSLELAPGSRQQVLVPITAESSGDGELAITLTLASGAKLEKTVTIPVRNNQPKSVKSSVISLAPDGSLQLGPETYSDFVPDTASVFFSVGGAGRLNVPAILSALDRYPYGCTEQLTSRALPLLYLDQVALAAGLRGDPDVRKRVQKAIRAVLANQSASGSFGLWRPGSGDLWLDAFVTDFLTRARQRGFEVPQLAFDQALRNLKNKLAYAHDFKNGGEDFAYALYVLAANSRASIGDLRYYSETRLDSFATPLAKAQIAAALGLYGDVEGSEAVYRRALIDLKSSDDARQWRSDYGSGLRDTAAILTLASETGSASISTADLSQRIDQQWASSRYLSTQEHAWTLLAAHALIKSAEKAGIAIDGVTVEGPLYRSFNHDDLKGRPLIENRGTRSVDVLLNIGGVSKVPEPAGGNFYEINRNYYTLEGEPADLATVPQGGRLVAVLTITSMESRQARLIVNDPLPAGFEIDNPHILRSGNVASLNWLDLKAEPAHAEFRSDRFVAALDRKKGDSTRFQFAYLVRAVSPGSFTHPAAIVEDMYRPERRARTRTGRIEIVGPLR